MTFGLIRLASVLLCGAAPTPTPTEAIPKRVAYVCDRSDELVVTYIDGEPGAARVEHQGKTWQLPRARSASGARYSDGTVTLWNKGRAAMLEAPGTTFNCTEK
jgi:membrane-bound inhibitor of C-type lysozyme